MKKKIKKSVFEIRVLTNLSILFTNFGVVLNYTKDSDFLLTRIVGYVPFGAGVRIKRAVGFDTDSTCTYCMEFGVAVVEAVEGELDNIENRALLVLLAHGPEHTHYGLPPAFPS